MKSVKHLFSGFVIGIVMAIAPSCGTTAKCTSSNCSSGCCDAAGQCQTGTSNSACGQLGGTCQVCSIAQVCVLGVCTQSIVVTGGGMGGGTGGGVTGGGTGGGTSTCDGCFFNGTCISRVNSSNNTVCGQGGMVCQTCNSNQNCVNYVCTGSTGGGTGGGMGTCDGCLLPSGSCVPLSRTSVVNCGRDGARCAACFSGELCTDGTCMVPPSQKRVGDACTTDTECQGSGPGDLGMSAICKQMTTSGNGAYTGGYCTLRCNSVQCPTGSTCVALLPPFGEADAICWDTCSSAEPCRTPGYACYGVGNTDACWIDPLPPVDAGVPADKVGNACSNTDQCINPPDNGGVCLSREFNYNWAAVGGYCSKEGCISDAECSTDGGALCLDLNPSGSSLSVCVQGCPQDGGQSTCRNGYVCEPLIFRDGGVAPTGFCAPPVAPTPTSIGGACTVDVDCTVPPGSIADCIPPILPDGGPTGFTGGYCTRFDCADDSNCSQDGGAQCFGIGGNNTRCFQLCPSSGGGQTTCRSGYVCQGYRLADGSASADGICERACNAPGVPSCPTNTTCNVNTGYCQ